MGTRTGIGRSQRGLGPVGTLGPRDHGRRKDVESQAGLWRRQGGELEFRAPVSRGTTNR